MYRERQEVLESMGFRSYAEYLLSDLWRQIRDRAFSAHGDTCVLCGKRAHVLHHLSYSLETLTGGDLSGLVPLCNRCHEEVEVDGGGAKRSFRDALTQFNQMLLNQSNKIPAPPGRSRPRHKGRGRGRWPGGWRF